MSKKYISIYEKYFSLDWNYLFLNKLWNYSVSRGFLSVSGRTLHGDSSQWESAVGVDGQQFAQIGNYFTL